MLAKVVNDDTGCLWSRGDLESIASMLAPTVEHPPHAEGLLRELAVEFSLHHVFTAMHLLESDSANQQSREVEYMQNLAWLDWVQWPAMLVTVVAAWMIGSSRPGRRMGGFVCFGLSNVLWVIWGLYAGAFALIVLQICLFLMNLRGFKKNLDED